MKASCYYLGREFHSPEKGSASVPTLALQTSGSEMENASFKVTQA